MTKRDKIEHMITINNVKLMVIEDIGDTYKIVLLDRNRERQHLATIDRFGERIYMDGT